MDGEHRIYKEAIPQILNYQSISMCSLENFKFQLPEAPMSMTPIRSAWMA